jgi:hypothetical protein
MPQLGSNLSGLSNTAIMEGQHRSQRLLMMILMIQIFHFSGA